MAFCKSNLGGIFLYMCMFGVHMCMHEWMGRIPEEGYTGMNKVMLYGELTPKGLPEPPLRKGNVLGSGLAADGRNQLI